jgi:hypothetical protein
MDRQETVCQIEPSYNGSYNYLKCVGYSIPQELMITHVTLVRQYLIKRHREYLLFEAH